VRLLFFSTTTAPPGESSGAVQFEIVSTVERPLLIEMVVDGSMNGGEFLQTSHLPAATHRASPPNE